MSLLLSILIFIIIAAIVLWFASYILAHLPVDATLRNIILALIALILLLVFLQRLGVL